MTFTSKSLVFCCSSNVLVSSEIVFSCSATFLRRRSSFEWCMYFAGIVAIKCGSRHTSNVFSVTFSFISGNGVASTKELAGRDKSLYTSNIAWVMKASSSGSIVHWCCPTQGRIANVQRIMKVFIPSNWTTNRFNNFIRPTALIKLLPALMFLQ